MSMIDDLASVLFDQQHIVSRLDDLLGGMHAVIVAWSTSDVVTLASLKPHSVS